MRLRDLLLCLAAMLVPGAASAQSAPAPPAPAARADPALEARIAELPALLRGEGDYDRYFAPGFRAQVPKAQFDALAQQFVASDGAFKGVSIVRATSPWSADIRLDYAHGVATAQIVVDPAAPHQVTGLRVTGFTGNETSLGAVIGEFAKLPGKTGFALARLGSGAPANDRGAQCRQPPGDRLGIQADHPRRAGPFNQCRRAQMGRYGHAGRQSHCPAAAIS